MTAPKAISFSFLLLAASSFMVSAHAETCFKNDSRYETKVWYVEPDSNKTALQDVAPGGELCSGETEYEGYVGVVILGEQPPSLASVKVKQGGTVRITEETAGLALTAFDENGEITMQDRFAKPQS